MEGHNLFKPALYSLGSNQSEVEDAMVLKWINCLQMIEGRVSKAAKMCARLCNFTITDTIGKVHGKSSDGDKTQFNISYEAILSFATVCP